MLTQQVPAAEVNAMLDNPNAVYVNMELAQRLGYLQAFLYTKIREWSENPPEGLITERDEHGLWLQKTFSEWKRELPFLRENMFFAGCMKLEHRKLLKTRLDKRGWKWYSLGS